MERRADLPLGVVIERRAIDHPWQKWRWLPVAVVPGAAAVDGWRELLSGPGWTRYHAATLPLVLHRKETDAYRTNLSGARPAVYVVMRPDDDPASPAPVRPTLVTASPWEAQGYLESGFEAVEGVPMPEGLIAWVQAFIDRHHVDEPFRKRQRQPAGPADAAFGRQPHAGGPNPRTRGGRFG
jgi:hypothetical protein